LGNQEALIDARKPFRRWTGDEKISDLRAFVEDVRTLVGTPANEEHLAQMQALLKDSTVISAAKSDKAAA
jgi:hypothetical protein